MSETALALVQSITAVEFFKPGASKDLIDKVIKEATELAATYDVSTPAGEAGLRTLAAKLGKVKNRLEDEGKNLVSGKKAEIKLVDTERGIVWDRMESAQKAIRQPLTEKEKALSASRADALKAVLFDVMSLRGDDHQTCLLHHDGARWEDVDTDDVKAATIRSVEQAILARMEKAS